MKCREVILGLNLILIFTLAFFVVPHSPAAYANTSSSLEMIFPRQGTPVIQKKGESIEILVSASAQASNWRILIKSATTYVLQLISSNYKNDEQRWILGAQIPFNADPLLYNITIQARVNGGLLEVSEPRAVQVVEDFPDEFFFIHINDCRVSNETLQEEPLWGMIDEINMMSPAFVLFSGDLVWDATESDYSAFQTCLNAFEVPTFVCPGNHEFPRFSEEYGKHLYTKYIGLLNYSFHYGHTFFISVNTGLEGYVDEPQLAWIENELIRNRSYNLTIVQMHHNFFTRGGRSLTRGFIDLENRRAIMNLLGNYNVPLVLTGHEHYDSINRTGATTYIVTTSSGAPLYLGGSFGYRLIYVNKSAIASYTWNGSSYLSIPSGRPVDQILQEPYLSLNLTRENTFSLLNRADRLIASMLENYTNMEPAQEMLSEAWASYWRGAYEDARAQAQQAEVLTTEAQLKTPPSTDPSLYLILATLLTAGGLAFFLMYRREIKRQSKRNLKNSIYTRVVASFYGICLSFGL